MADTKKRRDTEVYENYWKFTAAHLDITGTKFNNCLNVIVRFIDNNIKALKDNLNNGCSFSDTELYKLLQQQIVDVSDFKGSDASLSARKVINQFVKIGFIYPFLAGYHPLVKSFILETNKEKKEIIFSKIFYESSSLASDVTLDNRNLKHVNFLLKTLDKNGSLDKKDISFADDGTILIGKNVHGVLKVDFEKLKLDGSILNEHRKRYLQYHRHLFEQKNEGKK